MHRLMLFGRTSYRLSWHHPSFAFSESPPRPRVESRQASSFTGGTSFQFDFATTQTRREALATHTTQPELHICRLRNLWSVPYTFEALLNINPIRIQEPCLRAPSIPKAYSGHLCSVRLRISRIWATLLIVCVCLIASSDTGLVRLIRLVRHISSRV